MAEQYEFLRAVNGGDMLFTKFVPLCPPAVGSWDANVCCFFLPSKGTRRTHKDQKNKIFSNIAMGAFRGDKGEYYERELRRGSSLPLSNAPVGNAEGL